MINRERFAVLITTLFESKLKTFTKETIKIWYELLKKYPPDDLYGAVMNLIETDDNYITVGKIISQMKDTPEKVKLKEMNTQWVKVLKKEELDQITERIIDMMGGKRAIESCPVTEISWKKKEFEQLYLIYCEPNFERGGKGIYLTGQDIIDKKP